LVIIFTILKAFHVGAAHDASPARRTCMREPLVEERSSDLALVWQ
jgi:hypothetical protein